ncbi:MAG: family 43 glycosylhydrolase [Bacteroidales bacterium]|nr:family 43 glycosylhydrolase [Bacteroidales bacterium]
MINLVFKVILFLAAVLLFRWSDYCFKDPSLIDSDNDLVDMSGFCMHTKDNNLYFNPLTPFSLPDPTLLRAEDGYFYLYATENIRNIPVMKSADLVTWELAGRAFTDSTRPVFVPKGSIWAPDINYINGQYVLYYSMSVWGGEWTCGIGVAVSDKPDGPFRDRGKLFISSEIGVQNSIDPFFIEDNGRKYLFWGSFHGIFGIELSDDGLSVTPGAEKRQIAGTAYEGTCIFRKGKYYYLFCSTGTCCEGLKSTYTTVAGRSENLFGPFINRKGESLNNNMHDTVIHGSERFAGTGHNSEIVTDDEGNTWFLYHAYDRTRPEGRKLMLDEILWNDDWPYVEKSIPSEEHWKPVFRNVRSK